MSVMQTHTVAVYRRGVGTSGLVETPTGFAVAHASVACLVEPTKAWRKATLLGSVAGKKFTLSWEGGEDIREGDRVVWNGKNYRVEYGEDDKYRPADALVTPYQVAILHEELI